MNVLLVGSVSMLVLTVVAGLKLRPPQRARFQRHNPSVSANMSATDQLNTPSETTRGIDSLVALVLQAVHLNGAQVCESAFTKAVLEGEWRNSTLTAQEQADVTELLRVCTVEPKSLKELAFRKTRITKVPRPSTTPKPQSVSSASSSREKSLEKAFSLTSEESSELINQTSKQRVKEVDQIIKDRSADCKPRKILVEIPLEPLEPHTVFLPACTTIERCGGCCKNNLNFDRLKCVPDPKGITSIKKKVVAVLSNGLQITALQLRDVNVEKHTKCKCVCRVQAQDCTPQQTYDSRNCNCQCKAKLMKTCPKPMHWDERSCKCRCPPDIHTECSTGFYFASNRCRCVSASEIMKDEEKRLRLRRSAVPFLE